MEHWYTKCWWECKATGNSHSLLVGMQNGTANLENVSAISCKTKCTLYHTIRQFTLLGIYLNELKPYVHTKTSTRMFIEALFIVAKTWKKPRCPSVGEQMHKLWYIQTMEYYSLLKGNELPSPEKTWWKLKCILLSQSKRATCCMIPSIWHLGKAKPCVQ